MIPDVFPTIKDIIRVEIPGASIEQKLVFARATIIPAPTIVTDFVHGDPLAPSVRMGGVEAYIPIDGYINVQCQDVYGDRFRPATIGNKEILIVPGWIHREIDNDHKQYHIIQFGAHADFPRLFIERKEFVKQYGGVHA